MNIVYETAEAVSAARCDRAVYEIARIMSRSSGTVGERGTAANIGGGGTSHTQRATLKQQGRGAVCRRGTAGGAIFHLLASGQ